MAERRRGWLERQRERKAERQRWREERWEGIQLKSDQAVDLGRVRDLELLFGALEALPSDAMLYLEGDASHTAQEVQALLDAQAREPELSIAIGTWWPRPKRWHIPMTPANLAALREFAGRHASPEMCEHLTVYREGRILLSAHDAGFDHVLAARDLPAEQLADLRRRLGS